VCFIDLAKGICIILVVMYHHDVFDNLPGIFELRMPLYFVLSGLFFKNYGSYFVFLEKKINRLFVPFVFFFAVGVAFALAFEDRVDIVEMCLSPFFVPRMYNSPIWFLICLLWVNLIFCMINLTIKRLPEQIIAVGVVGILGYFMSVNEIYLPLFLGSSFSAMPYFFMGYLLGKTPVLDESRTYRCSLPIGAILVIIVVLLSAYVGGSGIHFMENTYTGYFPLIYIVPFTMVVGVLLICKAIKWLPVVSYFGRYSIIVLGFHHMFMYYGYKFISVPFGFMPGPYARFWISMALCWLLIPLCRRFVPFFTAQSELIHFPGVARSIGIESTPH